MSVENLYSYLEYLNLAIDQLQDAVVSQEHEAQQLAEQLAFADQTILGARHEIDRLNAQIEVNAQQADARIQALEAQILLQAQTIHVAQVNAQQAAATQKKNAMPPQDDLFGNWPVPAAKTAPAAPTPVKTPAKASVANDQNALILAKKLDSTIDKVQRLIAQGK